MSGRGPPSGVTFEAEIGAFIAVLLALDLPLAQLCTDLPGRPRRIYFQTPDALDDIVIDTDVGTVFVLAKRRPAFSASGSNSLGEVAQAIVAQYRAGRRQSREVLDPARDRLLIVVGEQTSGSIARDLREALSRIATGSATAIPAALAKSLEKFSSFLEAAWFRLVREPISTQDLAGLLALTRVAVVSPDGLRHASGLLRQHLASAEDSERIFGSLKLWAVEMAERGAGGDRRGIVDLIEGQCGTTHGFSRRPIPHLGAEEVEQIYAGLTRDALSTLEHSGLFQPSRTVRRDHFHDEISKFMGGCARLMPVIGVSGVGKTTALATLLGETNSDLPPRWFVPAAETQAGDEGIRSLLQRSLDRSRTGFDDRLSLDSVLAGSPRPPLLILDALNEADAIPLGLLRHSWIPRTLVWLTSHDMRLVFSCRPDVWALLADAFPSDLIHFPLPEEGGDDADPPSQAQPRDVFRLGDFSGSEAAEAVSLYGLSDWLPPDQVRHPFLLAMAKELHSDGSDIEGGFAAAVETFIRRRISRAAAVLKPPFSVPPMLAKLEDIAAVMLEQGAQTIEDSQAEILFGAQAPGGMDALISENLLTRSAAGLRFQHDQVGEYLQAKRVTSRIIARELSPRPGVGKRKGRARGFWDGLAEIWNQLLDYHVAHRANLRRDRSLKPSIAAFAIVQMLRDRSDPVVLRLLDGLYRSTHPYRTDHGFTWAAQTIQLVLDRIDPAAMARDEVLAWLHRLLERDDLYYYSEWPRTIAGAAAAAIVRANLPIETKQAFVPLLARQELQSWRAGRIGSNALDEAWRSRRSAWKPYSKDVEGTATGRLIGHLAATDISKTVQALGGYLDEVSDFSRKNIRGHVRPPLAAVAANSLYHFRAMDIDAVCDAALAASSGLAADLVEGLAISNPAELGGAAISRLGAATSEEAGRLHRAILLAAGYCPLGAGANILNFSVGALFSPEKAVRISGARIYLERYARYRRFASTLADDEANEFLDPLSGARDLALAILSASVDGNGHQITADDYLRLLEESFDQALNALERQVPTEQGPSEEEIRAVLSYISRVKVDGGRVRLDRAKALMRWLHAYADVHGPEAFDRLAEFVLVEVQHAGQSEYYVSESQLHELAIPELARRVIRSGGNGAMNQIARCGWPYLEEMREFFFEEVTALRISDEDLQRLVHNLFTRTSRDCPDPFERIRSLRGRGREEAWDRAGREYLWSGGRLESVFLCLNRLGIPEWSEV